MSETQAKCSLILLVKSSLCCAATSRLTSFIVVSRLHVALCQIVLWSYIYLPSMGKTFIATDQWSRSISNTLVPATSVRVLVVILTTISSAFLFFDFKSLNLFFGYIYYSIFNICLGLWAQMNWALIPRVKDWHKVSLKCSPMYLENL